MRILQYKQDLFGQGYTVVGSDVRYESLPGRHCNPIKMTNLIGGQATDNVENLVRAVDVDWGENEYLDSFFYQNYADILRGKYPKWELLAFRVVVGYLCLSYFHKETKDEGYLLLGGKSYSNIKVRFDAPSVSGGAESKYIVAIGTLADKSQYTLVTEYPANARREIEFYFKDLNKTDPFVDQQYIEVTEYIDF